MTVYHVTLRNSSSDDNCDHYYFISKSDKISDYRKRFKRVFPEAVGLRGHEAQVADDVWKQRYLHWLRSWPSLKEITLNDL